MSKSQAIKSKLEESIDPRLTAFAKEIGHNVHRIQFSKSWGVEYFLNFNAIQVDESLDNGTAQTYMSRAVSLLKELGCEVRHEAYLEPGLLTRDGPIAISVTSDGQAVLKQLSRALYINKSTDAFVRH